MSTLRIATRWLAPLALVLALASPAHAQQILPVPANHVEDRAGVIAAATYNRLNALLADLELKTRAQLLVLTIDTTGGVPINDYTLRTAEAWKLGRRGNDNGGLIVVAVKDRKYWMTVGYGLEGALPDAFLGTIGRKHFQPHFRNGDYGEGLYSGVSEIVRKIAQERRAEIDGLEPVTAAPARTTPTPAARSSGGACVVSFLVLVIVVVLMSAGAHGRRRGSRYWRGGDNLAFWAGFAAMELLSHQSRSRRGWGGGGWSSGWGGGGFGGGGSFGGGGGGSFGGGGAGGGW